MDEGWILDCHLDIKTECMSLWIKKDDGGGSTDPNAMVIHDTCSWRIAQIR